MRAATEAVIKLLGRTHRERRRFFGMKRAAGAVIGARFAQGHVALDDIDDVDTSKQFLDKTFGDHGAIMRRSA